MSDTFFQLKKNNVEPFVRVDGVDKGASDVVRRIQQRMLDRAKKLSLNKSDPNLNKAIEFQKKNDVAEINAFRSPWYSFILKVAGFAMEDISKMWKDIGNDKNSAQPLANTPQLGTVAQINAASTGAVQTDERNLGQYLQNRQYFFQSATVRGYIFLTPVCFSHVSEAVSLLENMCNTQVDVDILIKSQHSTYFARLVALRIQISRFLSGRYYSLSSNYQRLLTQQGMLMHYFKENLGRESSSSGGRGYFDRL